MVEILSNGLERLGIKDDVRKAKIVMKYELMKFTSGKKIYIFGGIALATLIIMTVVNVCFGKNMTAESFSSTMVSFCAIIVLLGATLFSSVTICSEFEERTALILFTKPIGKGAIFVGKLAAALVVNIGTMLIYYILTAIITAIFMHGVPVALGASFFYCSAYAFCLTGIAILFSSFLKKASTSSILTFVFLFLVFPIIESVVLIATGGVNMQTGTLNNVTCWYLPDMASNAISACINSVYTDGLRDFFVMFLWGLVPTIAAFFVFKNREFKS